MSSVPPRDRPDSDFPISSEMLDAGAEALLELEGAGLPAISRAHARFVAGAVLAAAFRVGSQTNEHHPPES